MVGFLTLMMMVALKAEGHEHIRALPDCKCSRSAWCYDLCFYPHSNPKLNLCQLLTFPIPLTPTHTLLSWSIAFSLPPGYLLLALQTLACVLLSLEVPNALLGTSLCFSQHTLFIEHIMMFWITHNFLSPH